MRLQERACECRRTTQERTDRPQYRWHFIVGLDLVGATLENAAYGAIAPITSIERSLARALESFSSKSIDQPQDALRLAEMVERVIDEEFTDQRVRGWTDRLGLAQANLG